MIPTDILDKFKALAAATEIFLIESPANHYVPAPPKGWFAMRSNKRRIFLRLDNWCIPSSDEVYRRIQNGEFTLASHLT